MWASHLGDDAQDAAAADLKRKVTQSAVNVGATQSAIGIGLNFIPVIGQALSAVYSIVNMFTSRAIKARSKQEVDGIKERLTAHGEARKADVEATRARVEAEERAKLAGGVGDFFSNAAKRFSQLPDKIASVTEDPAKFKEEATQVVGTVTGRESLTELRTKLNVVEEGAKSTMDQQAQAAIDQLQSPEGRATIRAQLLKSGAEKGPAFLSAAPWVLGALAVVAIGGIILVRNRQP